MEIISRFSFTEILILMFAFLLFISVIVMLLVKLVMGIVIAFDKLNVKKISLQGAEFYEDPATGEKKPTRRTLRKKQAAKK